MNEMIERLSRALFEADNGKPPYLESSPNGWKSYVKTARLAIEAMRDPTREMEQAGGDYLAGNYPAAEACFRTMIDAALRD